MSDSALDAAGRELDSWTAPFANVAEQPELLDDLLKMAGVILPDAQRAPLLAAITSIGTLRAALAGALSTPAGSIDQVEAVLDVGRRLVTAVRALDSLAGADVSLTDLGRNLVDGLLMLELSIHHPLLRAVFSLLGLVDVAEEHGFEPPVVQGSTIVRNEFFRDRFHFDRVADLLRDPLAALRSEYSTPLLTTADGNALADKLFPRVGRVLGLLGVSWRYGINPNQAETFGDSAPLLEHALLVYADDVLAGAEQTAGLVFFVSAAEDGDLGLVVQPFGTLTSTRAIGDWTIDLKLGADIDVLAFGRHGATLLSDTDAAEITGSVRATLPVPEDGTAAFVLGAPTGSRLEIGGASAGLEVTLGENRQNLSLSADVTRSSLILDRGDFDGFIADLIPAEGVRADFDLGVAWSNDAGLRLRGAAGLAATLPVGLSVGGISVPSLTLALRLNGGQIGAEVAAQIVAELGPITAVVDRVGLSADVTPRADHDGNLGPVDVGLGFKPPSGVGLSIEVGTVTGGGFLAFDPARGEYSGALELEFAEFLTLKALGLITTRMPDGSHGFSLLIVITTEFETGLELGFGFTLEAVGGIIGLNRGMNLQALVEGVRTGSIESVAFPRDIIANAPRILSDLNTFFPAKPGGFLIGPMAKIGWGSPTLITISLGLIIEIPGNIAVVGVLRCLLPTTDDPLLALQVDFVGALEPDKSRVWFFAKLFDSRILNMTIDGGMGVLVAWGDNPDLVLTVGGFHPSFRPPALPFPVPDRLSVDILNQPGRLIRVSGYFAVTSNTVQFGAKAELRLSFSHFSIEGHLSFDALFRFSPFAFAIEISAGVSLKAFGVGLFGIDLRFQLEGPAPWRAHGRGGIGFLFFSISADFDITWGESRDTTLPPVAVLPLLAAEIVKPEGWSTRLPSGGKPLVTLRQVSAAEGPVLHPLGTLTVRQRAVPLDVRLDRIGGQRVIDGKRFSVTPGTGSGLDRVGDSADKFAMAQFQDMSDAAKLSRPSYETQDAGLELAARTGTLLTSRVVRRSARYELHILDGGAPATATPARARAVQATGSPTAVKRFHDVNEAVFDQLLGGNSTSRSALSRRDARLRQPFAETIQVREQRYVVAYRRSNLQAFPPGALPGSAARTTFRNQTTAADALSDWVDADPTLAGRLHVIPAAEAAASPAVPGTWTAAGILPTRTAEIDAVPLASGRILVAGGTDAGGAAVGATSLFDPTANAWSAATPLATARRRHTTTRLPDGSVLVVGGQGGPNGPLAEVERFDPAAGTWAKLPNGLATGRFGHTATWLPQKRLLLVAGGTAARDEKSQLPGGALTSAELFDPIHGTWTPAEPMTDARSGHRAVLLDDGRVLVVGGELPAGDGGVGALAYCELYDPDTGRWSPTADLAVARSGHQATLLPDHRVLVTGGDAVVAADGTYSPRSLDSAEVFDPVQETWTPVAAMPGGGRSRHRAVALRSGIVLVVGGSGGPEFTAGYRAVLAYDPQAEDWTSLAGVDEGRSSFALAVLDDQRVLVTGGVAAAGAAAGDPGSPPARRLAAGGEVLIP